MYKLSIPLSMNTINDQSIWQYIDIAKQCKAERIFICGYGHFYETDSTLYTSPQTLKKYISIFRENGFEVGVWVTAFGHGVALSHETDLPPAKYTQIQGINGEVGHLANCPLDPAFIEAYAEGIKRVAALSPDLIMLDDDFRMNGRKGYHFGCFCHRHLEEYYRRLGERPTRDQLESLILSGGKNKYRSTYLALTGEVLLNFAKTLRDAVDSVDAHIRLGVCGINENWDFCGSDLIELSKAFAGNTPPFARITGAPYWRDNTIHVIEASRQQFAWGKHSGIEFFTEGDVYPRPRYNVPSKLLELFDLTLLADGNVDGQLSYMLDYSYRPEYEMGYVERYLRNEPLRNNIKRLFDGKKTTGVYVFNQYRKAENLEIPKDLGNAKAYDKMLHGVVPPSRAIISGNSIPTTFEMSEYPVFAVGENAKYLDRKALKNGAILDARAAEILKSRGIDVGLISSAHEDRQQEHFIEPNETVIGISTNGQTTLVCDGRATVYSRYLPDNATASYTYENDNGERFYVLGYDWLYATENVNYMNNYHRQSDLIRAVEWLCGKKLPAIAKKNPRLYILASKDENAMSVLLSNVFLDDVFDCTVQLDKTYSEIEFVNCEGVLERDKVVISSIAPYGVAAFMVK